MMALCGGHLLCALHMDRDLSFTPETGSEPGYLALKGTPPLCPNVQHLSGKEHQSCCYLVTTSVPGATDESSFSPLSSPAERKVHDGRMKGGPMFKDTESWLQRKVSSWFDGGDRGV